MFDFLKNVLSGNDITNVQPSNNEVKEVKEVPEKEELVPSLENRYVFINKVLNDLVVGEIMVDKYKNIYVVSNSNESNNFYGNKTSSDRSIILALIIKNGKRSTLHEMHTFNNIEYERVSSYTKIIKPQYASEEYDRYIKSSLYYNEFKPIEEVLSSEEIIEIFTNNIDQFNYAVDNFDIAKSRRSSEYFLNYMVLQKIAVLAAATAINEYQERPKKHKLTFSNTQYVEFIRKDYKDFDCTNDKEILRTYYLYNRRGEDAGFISDMENLKVILHEIMHGEIKFKFLEMRDVSYIDAIKNDILNFNRMSDINKEREQYNQKAIYKFRDLRTVFDYQAFYELNSKSNEKMPIDLFTYIDWRLTLAKNNEEKSKSGVV